MQYSQGNILRPPVEQIRIATVDDKERIGELWMDSPNDTYTIHCAFDPQDTYYVKDPAVFRERALSYLEAQIERELVFITVDHQGVPIGCVVCDRDDNNPDEAEIAEVFVHDNVRGKGLGTALLSFAATHLYNKGVTTLRIQAHQLNYKARLLYRGLGAQEDSLDFLLGLNMPGHRQVEETQRSLINAYQIQDGYSYILGEDRGLEVYDAQGQIAARCQLLPPSDDNYFDNIVTLYIEMTSLEISQTLKSQGQQAILKGMLGYCVQDLARFDFNHLKVTIRPDQVELLEMLVAAGVMPNQAMMHFDLTDINAPLTQLMHQTNCAASSGWANSQS